MSKSKIFFLTVLFVAILAVGVVSAAENSTDSVVKLQDDAGSVKLSSGEKHDVDLSSNLTVGIYGNDDTVFSVSVKDKNGSRVNEGSVTFLDVFGKNYTVNVKNGLATSRVFIRDIGSFNITYLYSGGDNYRDANSTLFLYVPVCNTTCHNFVAIKYANTVYFTGNVVSDYRQYSQYGGLYFEEVTRGYVTIFVDGVKLGTCDLDVNGNFAYFWNTTDNITGKTINASGYFKDDLGYFNPSNFSQSFTFEYPKNTYINPLINRIDDDTNLITGRVVDENGNPVCGGGVVVNGNYSICVNSEGEFTFYITNKTITRPNYEIGVMDWGSKADITKNQLLMDAITHTPLSDSLIELCKQGSPYIKFGNGNGKTVVVNVGTHGEELPSQVAGFKLIEILANYAGEINGTIYVFPVIFPQATASNVRVFNETDLNRVADIPGTLSNNLVNFAKTVNASGLGDFHATRHSDSDVGITCVMCSVSPTVESYRIARYIVDKTGYGVKAFFQAGSPYAGAIEDYSNIIGIPAITSEVLSNHKAVEYGSPEVSLNMMISFLSYFGFSAHEIINAPLTLDNISFAFTSPYNYNPSNKTVALNYSSFSYLNQFISDEYSPMILTRDIIFNKDFDENFTNGIVISRDNIVIDGNEKVVDAKAMARIFNITGNNVTLMNFKFINAFSDEGSALYITGNNVKIINCQFLDGFAKTEAGAIFLKARGGEIINSTFINCSSYYTGAVLINSPNVCVIGSYFENNRANISAGAIGWANKENGLIDGCKFIGNSAHNEGGGAIFWNKGLNGRIINSEFKNNYANFNGSAIFWSYGENGIISNCSFKNNDANVSGGAIFIKGINITVGGCEFINNVADYGGALFVVASLTVNNSTFADNAALYGNEIIVAGNNTVTLNNVNPNNITPVIYVTPKINVKDIVYGDIVKITLEVISWDVAYIPANGANASVLINNKLYCANVSDGKAVIEIPDLNAGSYECVVVVDCGKNYTLSEKRVSFNVVKQSVKITAQNRDYVITYGGKYSAALSGTDGEKIVGKKLTFILNGKNIGSVNTNSKGIAVISLTSNVLKSLKAGKKKLLIKFENPNYNALSKTVKIIIKKEKTKIIAPKKTFNKSKMVKKYAVLVKNSKSKPVKKVRVILKINGKNYKALTNSKGKAIFKIKNLVKKGRYTAKITFKGNGYYNKAGKKVKVTVK